MSSNYKLVFGVVLGAALGAAAVQGLHAQAKPKAYSVTETEVLDATAQAAYSCLYQKLNSTIMVVKATDDRLRCDAAYVLDGTMDWSVFAKRPMSPQLIIISGILRQDSA